MGERNHPIFVLFISLVEASLVSSSTCLWSLEFDDVLVVDVFGRVLLYHNIFFSIWCGCLVGFHIWLISVNLTSNEFANWKRYPYLHERFHYRNPFDLGCWSNWLNFGRVLIGASRHDTHETYRRVEQSPSDIEAVPLQRVERSSGNDSVIPEAVLTTILSAHGYGSRSDSSS